MNRATKLVCPSCAAPLKSTRGVRIGRKITCPKCRVGFTVRPEDAAQAEEAGGVNLGRLKVVLALALVYVLGGAGLALYCFENNASRRESAPQQPAQPVAQANFEDDGTDIVLPPKKASGPSKVSAAEQRAIDDAIAKGVWFLRDYFAREGSFGNVLPHGEQPAAVGFTSLAGLTLLECGVSPKDAVIQGAAKLVRQQAPPAHASYDSYQRAVAILFLDKLGEYDDQDLIRYLALCLIAAQHPTEGSWSYSSPVLDRSMTAQLLSQLRDKKQPLAEWRKAAMKDGALVPHDWDGPSMSPRDWDNSNTQFAILALWVAQRHGVPIEQTVRLIDHHFTTTQMPQGNDPAGDNVDLDGSWYYDRNGAPGWRNSIKWPSMTCAGLLGLGIVHGMADDGKVNNQKPLDNPAIQRALAMLGREIDRPNERRDMDLYFLWSLERVGVLYQLEKISGKDWYAWGRKIVLAKQQTDPSNKQTYGSWTDSTYYNYNPVVNTCFALLFLKQANLAEDLTEKLRLLASLIPPPQMVARKDP